MRALPPSPIWLLAPFLALTTSEPISLVPRGNESSSPAPATPSSNPNHIFNAIHSSMRQWGSSLNHNGMSAFLATVPEGVQLYHGTSNSEPVEGMEWLAFEPEHALLFARPRGPPPGREPPGHGSGPDDTHGGVRRPDRGWRRANGREEGRGCRHQVWSMVLPGEETRPMHGSVSTRVRNRISPAPGPTSIMTATKREKKATCTPTRRLTRSACSISTASPLQSRTRAPWICKTAS
ncbi:hypothetical protein H2203_007895 [Taxawa tesnikishii (nom. ined.)]|nr:hypothetical protein H2203_007895 [Dothideales sp. JES 119]